MKKIKQIFDAALTYWELYLYKKRTHEMMEAERFRYEVNQFLNFSVCYLNEALENKGDKVEYDWNLMMADDMLDQAENFIDWFEENKEVSL